MGACVKAASDEGSVLGELTCERWAILGRGCRVRSVLRFC